ncbi:hypothetical protein SERLA73DRAFT_77147 [Serpula lacrymans var. lacrymans S7.3]|uniref:DNA polymerase n=2 Tax=Serpula lacrymans var. lacrymans TaxID=341189 RepID=F8Q982_SERL3|nr:uncharacterized protein SERLADRAFT_441989 [Serpula lacrymans var. lacrymans S7.9]EGN95137.1 hypothetical protein SERLA73DRAFT_77147 [Serpula lacrymans var. lacrymans S7.3]EGO20647.1 hypothetical protein SERLADRAFT_441989 [Serpula lacrymans var. lacrymans S7.9]
MTDRSRRERKGADKLAVYRRVREGGAREWKQDEGDLYDEVTDDQYKHIVRGRLQRDDFVVDDGVGDYMDNGMDDWTGNGDEGDEEEEEEEEYRDRKKKSKKKSDDKSRGKPKVVPPVTKPSISAYRPAVSVEQEDDFMANLLGNIDAIPATTVSSSKRAKKRKPSPESDYDDSHIGPASSSPYRHRTTSYSSDGPLDDTHTNPPSSDYDYDPVDVMSPKKKVRLTTPRIGNGAGITPAIERMGKLEVHTSSEPEETSMDMDYADLDMDAFMDINEDLDLGDVKNRKPIKKEPIPFKIDARAGVFTTKPSTTARTKKEEEDTPSWLSVYDSLAVAQEAEAFGPSITSNSKSQFKSDDSVARTVFEPDGSLRFFWLDCLEHGGKLFFIGKVLDKSSSSSANPRGKGQWMSACITVENLQRNLFILPREYRVDAIPVDDEPLSSDDSESKGAATKKKGRPKNVENGMVMHATDVVPSQSDVYDDFDRIRRKCGVKSWKGRWVKRNYAFDESKVPKEGDWMKVVYGFDDPPLPSNAQSPHIARIFGTNTSAFELFVLKRRIMGPCWLSIKNAVVEGKGISWCKLEASVSDPKDVSPIFDNTPDAPPLTIMSLAVRTVVNHHENKREIVCVTGRIWKDVTPDEHIRVLTLISRYIVMSTNQYAITVDLDDPTPPEQLPCSVHTLVRPLDRFPPNFEVKARSNGRGMITPMKNERMLLNSLLTTMFKADPDVLVGHDFLGVSLDVLIGRMKDLKADHWSRLSRFRRSKWPNIGRQGTNLKFLNGRLLCDLASDGARSMISSTTWSLTEMCKTHLKSDRQDIDPDDTATYFDGSVSSPEKLLTFVRHCELDAHYQMAIASKVQILPLTRQLTNLAGNAWNKTLNGGRAERNEYILLHEFHKLKYICPDKTFGKKALPPTKSDDPDDPDGEGGAGGGKGVKGKRDKYKGGLVFEPKRGLWDKYILVMDFNSLYPSIIQEYNIDFTTVERDESDDIPEPPPSEVAQGVLPRLIATLVSRRRQVKSLMKDKSVSHAKLLQYDIKQQALKLTANSMYGCLGFEYSRFYARPLAALTTFKGREILTHTRELAESLQLDVVYGDTDSVFVNSNVTELSEALKISAEFKKAVNDRYKLLEIDLDGIFARLLLLQKKKYAAIKVEDGSRTSTEVKGLDMKRREYCVLSKSVSQYVLDQILSGEATETVVERIHEYLATVGENVRGGKVKLDDFIVYKRLGKNPEDYPDAKSQPHVQVAMRMKAKGGSARSGDVIPYVFCIAAGEESAKSAQAERAKHPDEIKKAAPGEMNIDYEHYLALQVLPPIERLCEPIEGTDKARLAECLGLDPARFRSSLAGQDVGMTFGTLDSRTSDSERFRDAIPFIVRCRSCKGQIVFAPINDGSTLLRSDGPICPACKAIFGTASLIAQLEVQIRKCISRYYEFWTVCDDPTCGARTRGMGVYGRRCLRRVEASETGGSGGVEERCKGNVRIEYGDADLYDQMRYFASLFDAERAVRGALDREKMITLTSHNVIFLQTMMETVEKYTDQCGRRWVDLKSLFS